MKIHLVICWKNGGLGEERALGLEIREMNTILMIDLLFMELNI